MSRAKPRAWVIIAAVGSALILATAYAALSWKRPTPIRIAFANSLTGPTSRRDRKLGRSNLYRRGQPTGGVNGRRIELVLFDDASSAEVARDNGAKDCGQPLCWRCWGTFSAPCPWPRVRVIRPPASRR